MDLVKPEIGLIFWTTIVFILLVILLKKYAWKPILTAVEKRNITIKEALESAEKAKKEMEELIVNNEKIITEAKKERDLLLKEAREIKNQIISDAKNKANNEAEKIIKTAKDQITNEKMKALTELKNQVADLAIEMTEKVIGSEFTKRETQKKYVDSILERGK